MTSITLAPADQHNRDRIADELDQNMLVEAAAGTGKTTSMIGRMVALLKTDRCSVETLAAVTFTRKAAAELRSRFEVQLKRAAAEATGAEHERLAEAQTHIERCFIGTIHSFCGRILRERPVEAGVDLGFAELDELDDFQLREHAWREFIAEATVEENSVVDELLEVGLDVDRLRGCFLTYAQYPDVDDWPCPKLELGDLGPTRQALRQYLRHIEALVGTFPPARGNDKLMETCEKLDRLARHRDLDHTVELMQVLEMFKASTKCVQKEWPGGQPQGRAERDRWQDFCGQVEPIVARWHHIRYEILLRAMRRALATYDRMRSEQGALNFQDLLMKAAALLRDKPQIRKYFRSRFTHLLVDEFQDTDPVQAEVMLYLTADDPAEQDWTKCRPEPGSLFVVGDPKQSIFRFRRADIVTYNQVKNIIRESGGQIVTLTTNFRSREELVNWGNGIFDQTFPREETIYSPAPEAMDVGRTEGCDGELKGLWKLSIGAEYENVGQVVDYESDLISRTIRDAVDRQLTVPRSEKEIEHGARPQVDYGDFLIITWTKKRLADYAAKLQQYGIPHQVSGSSALGQIDEIGLLLTCLKVLVRPHDPIALVALLRGESFGFSDRWLYEFKSCGGRFYYRSRIPEKLEASIRERFANAFERLIRYEKWVRTLPPLVAVEKIATELGLIARSLIAVDGNHRAGTIFKIIERLRTAQRRELLNFAEVVQELEGLATTGIEFDATPARLPGRSVVRLMNLHKCKGLEAPIVFLADPTGSWSPAPDLHIDRSGEKPAGYMAVSEPDGWYSRKLIACPEGWEEYLEIEKNFDRAEVNRLLYVAATRAGSQLVITQRQQKNNTNYWRFFDEHLDDAAKVSDPGPQQKPVGGHVDISRSHLQSVGEALHQRRADVSRPTYQVRTAKELALSGGAKAVRLPSSEHGSEWGSVIHLLLETAMRDPGVDLHQMAYEALDRHELDRSLAEPALELVASVRQSDLWQRALASDQVLVEVPFEFRDDSGATDLGVDGGGVNQSLVRGVIDLIFKEPAGWCLVDYKTEKIAETEIDQLVAKYRGQVELYADYWQQITGEAVANKGVFSTHLRRFEPV